MGGAPEPSAVVQVEGVGHVAKGLERKENGRAVKNKRLNARSDFKGQNIYSLRNPKENKKTVNEPVVIESQ